MSRFIEDLVLKHRTEIAKLKTPSYVIFTEALSRQVQTTVQALNELVEIVYSVKANPHPRVLQHLENRVAGFDVSSLAEAEKVRSLALDPSQSVSFVGPAKTLTDNQKFIALFTQGVIVVESVEELNELIEWASQTPARVRVALRVDLSEKGAPNGKRITHSLQFGMTEDEALTAIRANASPLEGLEIIGFHFHSYSQHRSHQSLASHIHSALQFIDTVTDHGFAPRLINLGSGMGLSYFEQDDVFDLEAFKSALKPLVIRLRTHLPSDARIFMESGRYLVGESGIFLTRVVRVKYRASETHLILDGGFAQNAMITGVHMPLRRNFKHHFFGPAPSSESVETQEYSAFGPSCSVNDIVLQRVRLPSTQPGDLIWFENMGAYGKSFSPTGFLSFEEPEEYFL